METLITKLPGASSDETLFKIDEAVFSFNLDSSVTAVERAITIVLSNSAPKLPKLRIVGTSVFTDSTFAQNYGKEITLAKGSNSVYVGNGAGLLYIGGFGDSGIFDRIVIGNGTKRLYAYEKGFFGNYIGGVLQTARVDFTKFNISEIFPKYSIGLTTLVMSRCGVNGDISSLPQMESLTNLQINANALYGDVVNFAKFNNLTELYVNNNLDDDRSKMNLSGSLESLLDAMFAAGRVSGTLLCAAANSGVTYQGVPLVSAKTATFTSEGWSVA